MKTHLYAALLMTLIAASCLKQADDEPPAPPTPPVQARTYDWLKIADTAQSALNAYFYNAGGGYFTPQPSSTAFSYAYWPNAHALDALTDAYLRRGKDAATKQQMDRLIAGLKEANGGTYSNYYYDDMEWLLIASLRAYKETGDARYKAVADVIWPEVQGGWDAVSGGGFYWRKDRLNKNTPANAPAGIFAARLYQITNNAADLKWATDIWAWMKTHMIKTNGDVWDGIYTNVAPITYDNRLFSYNYGTAIGMALELWKATKQSGYLEEAVRIASQALFAVSRDGILNAGDMGDGGLFNGIFVRYLTRLVIEGDVPATTKKTYIDFLKRNAESMWKEATILPTGLIGPDWKAMPTSTTLTPQLSGVMLAEAMAELKRLNLLQ